MRTDHVQKLTSACANLARLAESVIAEHEQQIVSMEKILASANSAAGKKAAATEASAADHAAPQMDSLRLALDAVARAVDGGA